MSQHLHRMMAPLEVTVVYEPTRSAHDTLRSAYATLLSPSQRKHRDHARPADTAGRQDEQQVEGRAS